MNVPPGGVCDGGWSTMFWIVAAPGLTMVCVMRNGGFNRAFSCALSSSSS